MLSPLLTSLVLLLSLPSLALARPATKRQADLPTPVLPFNVANPGATPALEPLISLPPGPISQVVGFAGAVSIFPGSPLDIATRALGGVAKRAVSCLDSTTNDTVINHLFYCESCGVNVWSPEER